MKHLKLKEDNSVLDYGGELNEIKSDTRGRSINANFSLNWDKEYRPTVFFVLFCFE